MQRLVALLALVAGCAGVNESPRGEPVYVDSPVADAPLGATQSTVTVDIEAAPVVPPPPAELELPAADLPAAAVPPTPVLAPAKAAASAVPVPVAKVLPRKQNDPVAVVAPVAASLDVAALKARLRETAAIGVLAKIALSRQMDECWTRSDPLRRRAENQPPTAQTLRRTGRETSTC
jgi:hypothetical protein